MGVVIRGHFDTFHPKDFTIPADEAVTMHADYITATALISWAQSMRQVATRRPLEIHERQLLNLVAGKALGHPDPC